MFEACGWSEVLLHWTIESVYWGMLLQCITVFLGILDCDSLLLCSECGDAPWVQCCVDVALLHKPPSLFQFFYRSTFKTSETTSSFPIASPNSPSQTLLLLFSLFLALQFGLFFSSSFLFFSALPGAHIKPLYPPFFFFLSVFQFLPSSLLLFVLHVASLLSSPT